MHDLLYINRTGDAELYSLSHLQPHTAQAVLIRTHTFPLKPDT